MVKDFSEKKFGKLIQRTLLAGVFLSLFFFFLGFVFRLTGSAAAEGLLRTGVLLLAITPSARVTMLVYGYCRTKEYHLALAAFTVLSLLLVSALI